MAKKLDQIVIVDLEATCWQSDPPPGEEQEIIEIGVCLLEISSGLRYKKQSILVRPERSRLSPFCTQLTTLSQEQVDREGIPFPQAVEQLVEEYAPHDRTWASYGDFDRILFQRQCTERGIHYPFGRTHLNIKNLLAISLNLPYEIGLDKALAHFGMTMEGTHHRGDDDAWNIAAVLAEIFARTRSAGAQSKI